MKRMSRGRFLGVAAVVCGLATTTFGVDATIASASASGGVPAAFAISSTTGSGGADPSAFSADPGGFTQTLEWDGADGMWSRQLGPGALRLEGAQASGGRWDQGFTSGSNSTSQHYNRSAILTTLLLPGLAQYRLGEKGRGIAFMTVEAALWTGFLGYRIQGWNREDTYREMADLYAGVAEGAPLDDDFYKTIASWPSSDLYNEFVVRRLARTEGGDDLEAREAWYEANKVQGNETWNWSSDVARQEFATKRSDAQNSFKKSRNMIGLAVVNRVVAMIDAVLLSGRVDGSAYRLDMSQERDGGELVSRIALRRSVP